MKQPKYKIGDTVYVRYLPKDGEWTGTFVIEKPLTINGLSDFGNTIMYFFDGADVPDETKEEDIYPSFPALVSAIAKWLEANGHN